jgi:hypothetical protein
MAWLITAATFAILHSVKGGGWPTLSQLALWAGGSVFLGTVAWLSNTKGRQLQDRAEDAGRRFGERHRDKVQRWINKD